MRVMRNVVDGLRAQPLALALVIVNITYITLGYMMWRDTLQFRAKLVTDMMQSCLDLQKKTEAQPWQFAK